MAVAVGEAGVTDEALADALAHHPAGSLTVGADYDKEIESAPPLPEADSGAGPELMFYTSGTTARPKGVVHTSLSDDSGRVRGMEGQVALWGWTADDVYVMSGPAYHASHLGWGLCALYVGATTIITAQFEARSFLEEVARHRGTRSFMVPAHFIRILEIPEPERASAGRLVLCSHRPRCRSLPGGRQVQDDGGVSPCRHPRALRRQRGRRHQDLPRGVAGQARKCGEAVARGRDPHSGRRRQPGSDRRVGHHLHPAARTPEDSGTATTTRPPAVRGGTTHSPWGTSGFSMRRAT